MWTFDGEQWIQDDAEAARKQSDERHAPVWIDGLTPELQVIEIVPVVPRHSPLPPLPMP